MVRADGSVVAERLGPGVGRSSRPALALALAWTASGPVHAAPPTVEPEPREIPQDPDAATPRLRAGGGQPATREHRRQLPLVSNRARVRHVALTVSPLYAAFRMAFLGRPRTPLRGGGVAFDVDIALWRPVWLRLGASYSAHPVTAIYATKDDKVTRAAPGGTMHALDAGGAVVFGMDIGRVMPLLEAGLGVMMLRGPTGVQNGQLGQACASGGCDVGLVCAADNVCRQGVLPEAHAGAAIEVQLADHWSLGASIRYFALLRAPSVFPVYLQAALRLGVRF